MRSPRDLETAELVPAQLRFLEHFEQSELSEHFVLTGGTALSAFFLQHRTSEDIDLFSDGDVPLSTINAFLRAVPAIRVESFERRCDRKIFTICIDDDPLKVEFTKFPYPRVYGKVQVGRNLWVDSPNEILVNKLLAITDRREPKDDVDVYFLLRNEGAPSLVEAVTMAEKKFGVKGLRYSVQSRLLAVPDALPNTHPVITRDEIASEFRSAVKQLVAAFASE